MAFHNDLLQQAMEALKQVKLAEQAFAEWRPIRHEENAQEYLVSLLLKNR